MNVKPESSTGTAAAAIQPLVLLVGEPMELYLRYAGHLLLHGLRVAVAPAGPRGQELTAALEPDIVVIDLDRTRAEPAHAMAVVGLRGDDADGCRTIGDGRSPELVPKPCPPERLVERVLAACA